MSTKILTSEEQDLLATLVEDGWPLVILAPSDDGDLAHLQSQVIALLKRGFVGVYGEREDESEISPAEAEAILADAQSWRDSFWMISTTPTGNAALGG